MENDVNNQVNQEPVTITLSVGQWNSILAALSTAPFQIINQISDAVGELQGQAGPQVQAANAKHTEAA